MKVNVGDQVVSILGFRDIKIVDVVSFLERIKADVHPITIQVVDASRVAGLPHLLFAFLNAKIAHERDRRIADNLEMEILLYASGQRQIIKAINTIGVRSQTSMLGVILSGSSEREVNEAEDMLIKSIPGVRDDEVLEVKGGKKIEGLQKIFKITKSEVEAMMDNGEKLHEVLTWLIVERICLLSLNR